MPVIAPDPTLPFGLSAIGPALPPGPVPFGRKAWDNPVRFKLNRAYGDEFEYTTFAQLKRRWRMVAAVEADFEFPGGSSILWRPSSTASALTIAAPAGDFEAVLEFGFTTTGSTIVQPMLALIDSVGTGAGAGFYHADNNIYPWPLTTYNTGGAGSAVAAGYSRDGRRSWLAMRRTGTNLTGRASNDGATWTALTGNTTVSATAPYLAIARVNPAAGGTPSFIQIHRLNVYPGPTFFAG